MSITSDIRTYADTALTQGKQVVGQAQSQLNDVTGQANEFVGKLTGTARANVSGLTAKASDAVRDLRLQAEKTVNIDAIRSAVEPYLAQAKQYRASVSDRAEGAVEAVLNDKRLAKVITTAESLTGVVVDTVQQRVVKPVTSLTGLGGKPAPKKTPAARSAAKPAATRPARKAAAKAPAAKRTAAKRTAAKSTAAKSTAASSTAASSTARKAPAAGPAQS